MLGKYTLYIIVIGLSVIGEHFGLLFLRRDLTRDKIEVKALF